MKLNTQNRTLKLYDSIKHSVSGDNIVDFQFLTTDHTLEELNNIFADKAEVKTMYKLTDSNQLIVVYNDYSELIGTGTETINITENVPQIIQVENENGEMIEASITTPVIKECDIHVIKMRYHDPVKDIVEQNRADIDYIALMTSTDL